ncbi:hypothetical protein ACKX2L_05170 [Lachnospiraceae bacterium YH-ros2228]
MEVQIQDLVTSIRKEGVDAANAEAETILANARKKADEIVSKAKAEASAEKEAAERDIAVLKESARVSADQARRDAALAFRTEVEKQFERLLKRDVQKQLSDDALGKLIRAALQGEDPRNYQAEVAEVSETLKNELKDEIEKGLTICPTKGVKAGFRLASKDGSGYFDCTDEEIAEMMMPYFRNLEI